MRNPLLFTSSSAPALTGAPIDSAPALVTSFASRVWRCAWGAFAALALTSVALAADQEKLGTAK